MSKDEGRSLWKKSQMYSKELMNKGRKGVREGDRKKGVLRDGRKRKNGED